MHLHEYQTKQLLKKNHIMTPDFQVVSDMSEVDMCLNALGTEMVFVKIQVHAGGRGKMGGVQFGKDRKQVHEITQQLLGKKFINQQTGPQGIVASQVLLTPAVQIVKEYYISILFDRMSKKRVLIASAQGGVDIEETVKVNPDAVALIPIPTDGKLRPYHFLRLKKIMGWEEDVFEKGCNLVNNLCALFMTTDATLIEINPLILDDQQDLIALDAKMTIDDNALFRHLDLQNYFDSTQHPLKEVKAKEYDLSYVELEGDIGCMVNGAGLAMATMDMIVHEGGCPANFLDVGGSASAEKIAAGLNILLLDDKVKVIFIHIFGGIMDCTVIAEGILQAFDAKKITLPLVVRMEGTRSEEGQKMLKKQSFPIYFAHDMKEGAMLAVLEAKKAWVS